MQQTRRGGTDLRGVLCTALIPLCVPHLDAIPESSPSCKAPQFKDCGTFPRIVALSKAPQYGSCTDTEANHKSVAHFLSKSGAQMLN